MSPGDQTSPETRRLAGDHHSTQSGLETRDRPEHYDVVFWERDCRAVCRSWVSGHPPRRPTSRGRIFSGVHSWGEVIHLCRCEGGWSRGFAWKRHNFDDKVFIIGKVSPKNGWASSDYFLVSYNRSGGVR